MAATSSTDAEKLAEVYRRHVNAKHAFTNALMTGAAEVRAERCSIFDSAGNEWLDCGGHGVFLLGHRHPDVVAAVRAQLEDQPIHSRFLFNPALARAAEALARITPEGLEYVFFQCSGAEVVETAIKLARLAGRTRLVATTGGFHGKSMGALSLAGRAQYRDPFLPLLGDVEHVPYGDTEALAAVFSRHKGSCCFFVEPVQGEGGVRIPPPGYLREVEALCREHDQLLVLDEIQTGLGRLGRIWGADFEGIRPDMLLSGKALGGGVVPVSAVVATPELYAPLNRDPYLHSTTFANAPIMAAAAAMTIHVLETTDVVERAASIGRSLLDRIRAITVDAGSTLVAEVRGVGLLLAIEFTTPGVAGEFLLDLIAERRVLPSYSLNSESTIRFTPSALISEREQEWLLDGIGSSLQAVRERIKQT
jgi:putrescine aminotransferase